MSASSWKTPSSLCARALWTLPRGEAKAICLAVGLLFLGSQIALPFYPVPLALGSASLLAVGMLLPPGQAFLSVLFWITLGALGLPVFACLSSGPGIILGPRGGYLLGYLCAAPLVSFLVRRSESPSTSRQVLGCIVACAVILTLGWARLGLFMESGSLAWEAGVFPFLFSEPLKCLLVVKGKGTLQRFFP